MGADLRGLVQAAWGENALLHDQPELIYRTVEDVCYSVAESGSKGSLRKGRRLHLSALYSLVLLSFCIVETIIRESGKGN